MANEEPNFRKAHARSSGAGAVSRGWIKCKCPNLYQYTGFGDYVTSILETMTWTAYFWVALGSGLGGAVRVWSGALAARQFGDAFPWGTLLVNVVGCFAIGFFAALAANPSLRLLLMPGFCGGFTTFSTFGLETLALAQDGRWARAGANVFASIVLCMAAVWLGGLAAAVLAKK